MPQHALILGASRGLGLGLVTEFQSRGWQVIATERTHSEALHATGVTVETADVTDHASIDSLAARVTGPLDLLFIVSGQWGPAHQDPLQTSADETAALFMANVVGPVAAAMKLASKIAPAGTIAFMTSEMGSIAGNTQGGAYLYRASKAALNAMAKSFSLSKQAQGRTVLAVHPGWVRTDMGGPSASIDVATSVRGMAEVIAREAGKGGFRYLDYQGRELPW